MIDYAKALKRGLDAANRAAAARKEIDQIFQDLDDQVLRGTKNKVSIRCRTCDPGDALPATPHVEDFYPHELSSVTGYHTSVTQARGSLAIAAFNPTVGSKKQALLALCEIDRAGYPFQVTWNDKVNICEDGEALRSCLADLLSDPLVGQKIHNLMTLQPQKAA